MIEPSHEVRTTYQSFSKFRSIMRENFPRDGGLLLGFYSDDISTYHGLESQLTILDKVFTAYYGIGDYRNLVEAIRLACFIKFSGINIEEIPITLQLNFNGIVPDVIHHDSELTSLILSQLPYPKDFSFGKRNYGADTETENIMIELGDTFIRKVAKGLETYNEVRVIPIYKSGKVKSLENIYRFTRGNYWNNVLWWKEKEEFDDDEDRRLVMQNISWGDSKNCVVRRGRNGSL